MKAMTADQPEPIGFGKLCLMTAMILVACSMSWASTRANAASVLPQEVKLVTTNWPPYTDQDLPDYGTTSKVVKNTLSRISLDYAITVYPWQRALRGILRDKEFDGIYPLYHTTERAQQFLLSDPVGTSPLGFVHLQSLELAWHKYSDLAPYTIGFVNGYTYEPVLRKLLDGKQLDTVGARDDRTLIRQLIAGHIEIAVMDHNVARHLVDTHPGLSQMAERITYNPHLIIKHTLHVGFVNTPQGHALLNAFNAGLRQLRCDGDDGSDCNAPPADDETLSQNMRPETLNSQ